MVPIAPKSPASGSAFRRLRMREANAAGEETQPAVEATTYVRFIILTYARTGSTMFAASLNSSPNIICFRELFNPIMDGIGFYVDGYDNSSAEDRALRDRDFKKFLQARIFCEYPREIRAVGFKMPHVHFRWFPGLLEWLVEHRELRVVHLERRNLLRMLVSLRIAQKTGGWSEDRKVTLASKFRPSNALRAARHPLTAANRLRKFIFPKEPAWKALRAPLTLSEEECRSFFAEVERDSAHYRHLFREHPQLTLFYEDLLQDRKRAFNQAQSFLGGKPRGLSVTTRRQNPEPLRGLLANHEELYTAFKGTPQEAFFG
jgi:hypothetical protein